MDRGLGLWVERTPLETTPCSVGMHASHTKRPICNFFIFAFRSSEKINLQIQRAGPEGEWIGGSNAT